MECCWKNLLRRYAALKYPAFPEFGPLISILELAKGFEPPTL